MPYRRLALILVLVLAALLRVVDLSHAPVALNQDEAVNGYDAYSIAYTLRDHHGNFLPPVMQSFNDYASPLTTYVTVPFVRLLGLSEFSIRLPPALLGVASVLLIALFLERIGCGWGASMLGGLLLALSPWHITYTRWAVPTCAVPFVLLWLMYVAVGLLDGPPGATWRRALLVGLAGGLLTYTYPAQKVFAPLVVGFTALVYLWPRREPPQSGSQPAAHSTRGGDADSHPDSGTGSAKTPWLRRVIDVLLMFAVLAVFMLPHVIQQLTNPAKYAWHTRNVLLVGHTEHLLSDVATRYADYFSFDFFYGAGDPNLLQHVPGPASFVTLSPLVILGLMACVFPNVGGGRRVETPGAGPGARLRDSALNGRVRLWLIGLVLIAPLPGAITIERMHSARAIQLLVLVTMLMAIGMHWVATWLPTRLAPRLRARNVRILAFTVVIVLASAEAWRFTRFYVGEYRELSKPDFQYGVKQALQMVEPLRCHRVLVDARINQPYIYYLFYARYPPRLLDYGAINENIGRRIGWLVVTEIGRYQFINLPASELAAAHRVGDVNDERRTWYSIFRNPQSETCIVQKRTGD